jgi:ribosomal protein S18 acetylase RimI-like enzyme
VKPSHELTVRRANLDDVKAIAQVHVAAWRAAYRGQVPDAYLDSLDVAKRARRWSRILDAGNDTIHVCARGGTIVGFSDLTRSRDADASVHVGEIAAIYVEPSSWRKGCGGALMQASLRAANERGFAEVTLWVLATNVAAQRFYECLGFTSDGATKTEKRPGFDLHEVRYRLAVP